MGAEKFERNAEILVAHEGGKTFREIAVLHGITPEAVRQIVVRLKARERWRNRKEQEPGFMLPPRRLTPTEQLKLALARMAELELRNEILRARIHEVEAINRALVDQGRRVPT